MRSDTGLPRSSKFCFSLVQFRNRDVSSLLALFKAIIVVYVRFYGTNTYLSNEINAALEWTLPSNKRRTKLSSKINKRRGVQSIKYGILKAMADALVSELPSELRHAVLLAQVCVKGHLNYGGT